MTALVSLLLICCQTRPLSSSLDSKSEVKKANEEQDGNKKLTSAKSDKLSHGMMGIAFKTIGNKKTIDPIFNIDVGVLEGKFSSNDVIAKLETHKSAFEKCLVGVHSKTIDVDLEWSAVGEEVIVRKKSNKRSEVEECFAKVLGQINMSAFSFGRYKTHFRVEFAENMQ
jgi:hypothetical protein